MIINRFALQRVEVQNSLFFMEAFEIMEMDMEFLRKLPTPKELKEQFPVSEKIAAIKEDRDRQIREIFEGKDDRLLLIIGPCSADNEDAVIDYISRLRTVQDKVADKIFMIPRIYTNKPRTIGMGYKGMLHQPDPEKKEDMLKGIIAIRDLHTRAVNETGFTCADEMLYPENHRYLSDLLSYVAIGARSVEDQQHRLTASGVGGRYEEPDRRRYFCHDEFYHRRTAWSYVPVPRLGSKNSR